MTQTMTNNKQLQQQFANAADVSGFPAGILLYNKTQRLVLLAYEKANTYAYKKGAGWKTPECSWSMAWGSRKQGETDYLQTAIREYAEEIGTPLPSMSEIEE